MTETMTIGSVKGLNRYSGLRKNADWLQQQLDHPNARIVVLKDMKPILDGNGEQIEGVHWYGLDEFKQSGFSTDYLSFLGVQDGRPLFSLAVRGDDGDLTESHEQRIDERPAGDLRMLALDGALSANELSLLGEARSLAAWHQNSRCCGRCGGRNRIKDGGWRLQCGACALEAFPRTDPVVIMLITSGDKCLVGRERRFPDMFYSALAGFMEHGEDVEDAVRREVHEETGIEVGGVHYHSSQPWPFPHTLMIGCLGEAINTQLKIDPEEIEDAIWISKDEARQALRGEHPDGLIMPGPYAIAHHLVKAFCD